jgi:hypothetical protein
LNCAYEKRFYWQKSQARQNFDGFSKVIKIEATINRKSPIIPNKSELEPPQNQET